MLHLALACGLKTPPNTPDYAQGDLTGSWQDEDQVTYTIGFVDGELQLTDVYSDAYGVYAVESGWGKSGFSWVVASSEGVEVTMQVSHVTGQKASAEWSNTEGMSGVDILTRVPTPSRQSEGYTAADIVGVWNDEAGTAYELAGAGPDVQLVSVFNPMIGLSVRESGWVDERFTWVVVSEEDVAVTQRIDWVQGDRAGSTWANDDGSSGDEVLTRE